MAQPEKKEFFPKEFFTKKAIEDRFMANSRQRMRRLAVVMLVASVLACLLGCFMILKCIHELNLESIDGNLLRTELAPIISELAEGVVLAVHYFFVSKFFAHAIKHGVPFTHEAAKEVKILGYETIFLPILAWIVSAIAYSGILPASMVFGMSVYEAVLGFALIIIAYMIDYGTDKIEAGHRGHMAIRYIVEHYPDVAMEAKQALIMEGYEFPDRDVFDAGLLKKHYIYKNKRR